MDTFFANVILSTPLPEPLTYRVPEGWHNNLSTGMRVMVPLGNQGLVTGVVIRVHQTPPQNYRAKYLEAILDEKPLVTADMLAFWEWIWTYYMCNPGDVLQAALPPTFKLQSESMVVPSPDPIDLSLFQEEHISLIEKVSTAQRISLAELKEQIPDFNLQIFQTLVNQGALILEQDVAEKFIPKKRAYLVSSIRGEAWNEAFNQVAKAPKQSDFIQQFILESKALSDNPIPIPKSEFLKRYDQTEGALNGLRKKGIIEVLYYEENRIQIEAGSGVMPDLSEDQKGCISNIQDHFKTHKPVLLHGVTGSGKTEMYIHLIAEKLSEGGQVLMLLPEIGISTQIIERIQSVFGELATIYTSKYSMHERHEIWQGVESGRFRLVVGTQSTLFLPFTNLQLVIVDEEHEGSHKQGLKSPRINAKDCALFLAKQHGANAILGTATPSMESLFAVTENKIAYVRLNKRFHGGPLPEILTGDLKADYQKKQMKGVFGSLLFSEIEAALLNNKQVLLFQNRRGYAPSVICQTCGNIQQCRDCDINLTYHKEAGVLKCHLCNNTYSFAGVCKACGSGQTQFLGYGTEQIEQEAQHWFPKARIIRVDQDTTKGKNSFREIIQTISRHEVDIIVGTQMIAKGFDFAQLGLVGIINGDQLMSHADFRANERAFQMIIQVAGRSGRQKERGKTVIQTVQPYHYVFRLAIEHNFRSFYSQEIQYRKQHHYPPKSRLIVITFSHQDRQKVEILAQLMAKKFESMGLDHIGPAPAPIERMRNKYFYKVFIKLDKSKSVKGTKVAIQRSIPQLLGLKRGLKSIRIQIDVDPA